MSSNLVIVAIPAEDDRVWKISSEEIPHLTLLFLGETDKVQNLEQIMLFVEHATTLSEHGPFYLDVDRRDTLGPDEADVLLFSKRSWNLKWIQQFRSQLLQHPGIKTAYDSTEQYPEWTPHLTLGYPETPAKPIPNDGFDHPIYSVSFDRIAVWTEDFSGPEFRLEWPEREDSYGSYDVAWSSVGQTNRKPPLTDALEHFGVKGMKWGQRKESVAGALRTANTTRKNVKFVRKANSLKNINVLVNTAAKKTKEQDLPKINAKYAAKGAKTHKNVHLHSLSSVPVQKQYREEVKNAYLKRLNEAANEKTNASGTRRYEIVKPTFGKEPTATRWRVKAAKIQHAVSQEEFDIVPVFDADGFIVDFNLEPVEDSMAQASEFVAELGLEHASVLDDTNIRNKIKAKIQSILDDVTGDADQDLNLFGDPIIRTKLQSVLDDFYNIGVDKAMAYSAMAEAYVEHFGIKGMKWGQRNSSRPLPQAVAPVANVKIPHGDKRKTKIEVDGGQNHPAHEDAIKVAEAKAKLKKSGPAALSNQELRDVASRVQLENQVAVLTSHKGKAFVTRQLQNEGQNLARQGVREGLKKGIKKAGRGAATAAVVAA